MAAVTVGLQHRPRFVCQGIVGSRAPRRENAEKSDRCRENETDAIHLCLPNAPTTILHHKDESVRVLVFSATTARQLSSMPPILFSRKFTLSKFRFITPAHPPFFRSFFRSLSRPFLI